MQVDTVIRDAQVLTGDGTTETASLAIKQGEIVWVGEHDRFITAPEIIDAAGRLVTPGIADTHNHLLLGWDPDAVNLSGITSLTELRTLISHHAEARPDLAWVCAENALYSVVSGRRPNMQDLTGVSDRPVFITTYDQHSVWLNDHALRALGVTTGRDIFWGKPERNAVGEPTGWITDFYTSAMTQAGLAQLKQDIPLFSDERRYRKLVHNASLAVELGITSVLEPQVPVAELPLFIRAEQAGYFPGRVALALDHPAGADAVHRRNLLNAQHELRASESRIDARFVKLYADDVIEPHTAALLQEYANRPGNRGNLSWEPEEYTAAVSDLSRLGFITHTHATGDWGIRMALDGIQLAQERTGLRQQRHGIVHVELLAPEDLNRFSKLGVAPIMQPRHASPDFVGGTWMENVGEARWDRAWRVRSLIESGAHVSFSSDWHVGEMDPLIGMYSALTRQSLGGSQCWTEDERVSLAQALHSYTGEGAWVLHQEQRQGRLQPGMRGDLVLWSADLTRLSPSELLEQRVDRTLVSGKTVHQSLRES